VKLLLDRLLGDDLLLIDLHAGLPHCVAVDELAALVLDA
jgi:hypothetical protein